MRRLYDDGRTNILFVGRVIPNKKIDDLIRVFALYQRLFDRHSRLLLVGDYRGHEKYYDRLQDLVRERGAQEVVFTGPVDDDELRAAYSCADLFLCLSEHEGFCVPLLEAMAFDVPVVAFDTGAVRGDAARRRRAPADKEPGGGGRGAPHPHRRCPARARHGDAGARDRRGAGHGLRRAPARPPPSGARGIVRIDQWVPALHRGDAIGDSARLMRDAFRSWGHQADVYALELDEDLQGDGRAGRSGGRARPPTPSSCITRCRRR